MSNDLSFKGAILVDAEAGSEHWQLTNDDEKLIAAADDEVLWASTANELKSELETRNPCAVPGLSRVWQASHDDVRVFPHPILFSADPDEVWNAVQQVGTVCVAPACHADSLQRHPRFADCIFKRPRCGAAAIIAYNPVLARKRAAQKEQKQLTVAELRTPLYALCLAVDPLLPCGTINGSDRKAYVAALLARLALFNVLYGKSAHRKFKPWQEFVALWKRRKAASDKAYRAAGLGSFVDFMDKECRARRVPPLPDKHFRTLELPAEIRLP